MAEATVETYGAADKAAVAKLTAQLKKIKEANEKYKNLLKLAKDRIEKQEEEVEGLRKDKAALEERLESDEKEAAGNIALDETADNRGAETDSNIVRVCQRIKVSSGRDSEEIWAFVEMEVVSSEEMGESVTQQRYKEWKHFDTEAELQDFIRRDTGEPLTLPPYSLSPEQSARIQEEADQHVSKVTEEFRRFRVRSELARKQADAQLRDLQSSIAQRAAQRLGGQDTQKELEQARTMGNQVERLKSEMAAQEAHWKEAYDVLLAENNALKSAGSEALLAAQWRQRYEACLKEKEDLESRLAMGSPNGSDKYEKKYRDLKGRFYCCDGFNAFVVSASVAHLLSFLESFRLYRKKAKEIFEAQQHDGSNGVDASAASRITSHSTADAKLSYLKNLMVNYLSAEPSAREHMEPAIGTVLQFTPEEKARIGKKKKAESASWF
jgi:endonuclease III